MTFRALITLAEGIDDLQTVTLIDVLRRAKVEVVVASIEGRRMLTCARGTRVTADAMLVDLLAQPFDLIVLPGGAVGAQHLAAHQPLQQLIKDQAAAGRLFAAIAESPAVALQAFGVLRQQLRYRPRFRGRFGVRPDASGATLRQGDSADGGGGVGRLNGVKPWLLPPAHACDHGWPASGTA